LKAAFMFAASGGTTSSEFIIFPHSPTPTQKFPITRWPLNWPISGTPLRRFGGDGRAQRADVALCLRAGSAGGTNWFAGRMIVVTADRAIGPEPAVTPTFPWAMIPQRMT
jgi:hypothetical protein